MWLGLELSRWFPFAESHTLSNIAQLGGSLPNSSAHFLIAGKRVVADPESLLQHVLKVLLEGAGAKDHSNGKGPS